MVIRLRGSRNLRQRLVYATLSGRAIRIDDIRAEAESPGLTEYEASLLRLLEKISNGCVVEINETGTKLRYRPGVLSGGRNLTHDCGTSRAIGYFLQPLFVLGLFGKKPLHITLKGVTNDDRDPSIDTLRTATLPILKRFGVDMADVELKLVRRGAPPLGGGEVMLRLPIVKQLEPVVWEDEGLVKRVRGVAFTARVAPQVANRMVDAARGVLNRLLPDVFIFTDHFSGADSGRSPGFGISLVAETTSGCLLSAERAIASCRAEHEGVGGGAGRGGRGGAGGQGEEVPEDLGLQAAQLLLHEVKQGGVVDGSQQAFVLLLCALCTEELCRVQAFVLLLCALCPEELCRVRVGPLTPHTVDALRDMRAMLGVQFDIRPDESTGTVFLSCIGSGHKNLAKPVT
ncbi:unnamed protein product [Closterium sp. Naga37s-1]|nr:unnamed protein product [Closterium sp. Naga37s-1]